MRNLKNGMVLNCYKEGRFLFSRIFRFLWLVSPGFIIKFGVKAQRRDHAERGGLFSSMVVEMVPVKGGRWHSPSPNW